MVGVLVLVDQHVPEPALVERRHLGEGPEQVHRLADQVVEVHRVGAAQARRVAAEDLEEHDLFGVIGVDVARIRLDVGELVLELGDLGAHVAGGEAEGVGIHLLDDPLDERAAVGGVVDGEALRHAHHLGLTTQDAHARGVERRDPHSLGGTADELVDPLAHLGRRLVGEGDGEDLARPRLPALQQPGDAAGEHARLARSGARDDQQGRPAVQHRLALARVEPLEQRLVDRDRAAGALGRGHPGLRVGTEGDGVGGEEAHDRSSLRRAGDEDSGRARPGTPPTRIARRRGSRTPAGR